MAAGKLPPKQQRFVEEYLKDLNAAAAYVRAGYKAKNGDVAAANAARLIGNDRVAAAVQEATAARSKRNQIDADWVLKRLVRNVRRASTVVAVLDREGNPTGEYRYEGNVVNKALELIGKHIGMFTDKVELSGPGGGPVVSEIEIVHHTPPPPVGHPAGGAGPDDHGPVETAAELPSGADAGVGE